MTDTINGKTPEEIKKGLECCSVHDKCDKCPYDGMPCNDLELERDALAYIQRLERERDQYKRERDAAVNALCNVNRVLTENGWTATTLCMSEIRTILWDGFIDVLCAQEVE